jgi:ATP-binding cassette subfamily F protein uup
VLLAKILRRGGNFLILDEPTNDLDLQTMRVLEEAILAFKGCVLVVSHDRYFLDRVCDQILAFEGSGRLHLCAGNYSYYQEKRAATAAAELALAQGFKAKGMGGKGKTEKPRKITQKELRELETIESEIVALEEAIAGIETQLNDPAFYIEHAVKAPTLLAEVEAKKSALEAKMHRWAELEEIKEASATV